MAEQNPFDAAIPGQSLTDEPGSRNWEKPPKYVRPQEALDYIWSKLMEEQQFIKMVALMEAGLPAQGIAETILFAGFTEGLWTPDVMIIIGKPVLAMVAAIGQRAGIKVKIGASDRDELDDFLDALAEQGPVANPLQRMTDAQPVIEGEVEEPIAGGLMAKKVVK